MTTGDVCVITWQTVSHVDVVGLSGSSGVFGRRRAEADRGENPRLALQQFSYDDDGFIACRVDDKLVLGVREQDSGHGAAVTLMNRNTDDVHQRWIIHDNGYQLQWKFCLTVFVSDRL